MDNRDEEFIEEIARTFFNEVILGGQDINELSDDDYNQLDELVNGK
jgi:phage head maturation protease